MTGIPRERVEGDEANVASVREEPARIAQTASPRQDHEQAGKEAVVTESGATNVLHEKTPVASDTAEERSPASDEYKSGVAAKAAAIVGGVILLMATIAWFLE